jgi:medium-chain acyl-[acyl-carrier-protein] hydrolase
MDKKLLWEENFPVFSFQCDRNKNIRLTSIAQFFQEMAWRHAEYCGVGYKGLLEKNVIWLLSGLRMKIMEYPVWEDNLKILTWGKEYVNLFAFREFEILNSRSETVVVGSSSWIVADVDAHRPVRITEDLQQVPPLRRNVEIEKPGKIAVENEYPTYFDIHVPGSVIDVYDHVNNTKYIEWCMDAVPELHEKNINIREFDIRFVHEAKFHDNVRVYYSYEDDAVLYRGINIGSSKEVFRAKALI